MGEVDGDTALMQDTGVCVQLITSYDLYPNLYFALKLLLQFTKVKIC